MVYICDEYSREYCFRCSPLKYLASHKKTSQFRKKQVFCPTCGDVVLNGRFEQHLREKHDIEILTEMLRFKE